MKKILIYIATIIFSVILFSNAIAETAARPHKPPHIKPSPFVCNPACSEPQQICQDGQCVNNGVIVGKSRSR